MRILLLGATGRTGRLVLARCVELGHHVTTYGRRPGGGAQALVGAMADVDALSAACSDVDAVISCLASSNAVPVCSQATQSLIASKRRPLRYILVPGASVEMPNDIRTPLDRRLASLFKVFFGGMLADRQMELETLASCDLKWTALRPPRLTNGSSEGAWVLNQDKPAYHCITRADLADAVISALARDDLIGQAPFVSAAPKRR